MRKIKFIINPVAGDGSSKHIIKKVHNKMENKGLEYAIAISGYKGDVERLAALAVEDGYNEIIAVGGDGTLLEAFNGIFDKNVALGIIPCGTGNDFIKMLEIPNDVDAAIEHIIHPHYKKIDTGRVNDYHFLNVVGFGIDGEIVEKTEQVKNILKGPMAYYYSTFSVLSTFKCKEISLEIDGEVFQRTAYMVAIGNGQYFGGGMKITPSADVESGDFQIVLIKKMPKLKFGFLFRKVFSGHHVDEDVVEVYYGKKIKVTSKDTLKINADGNIIAEGDATLEIIPKNQLMIV